jgi:hypothetical protein
VVPKQVRGETDYGVYRDHEQEAHDISLLTFIGIPLQMLIDQPEGGDSGDNREKPADYPTDMMGLEGYVAIDD